jgi:hypothetical protein
MNEVYLVRGLVRNRKPGKTQGFRLVGGSIFVSPAAANKMFACSRKYRAQRAHLVFD